MKKTFSILLIVTLTICSVLFNYINTIPGVLCADADIETTAKSAIVMDINSGEVIFDKDSNAQMQVASIVKLMTALLTLEEIDSGNISLTTEVTTTENASSMGGSQIFLDPYETYSIESLLKGVVIASANDASVALAEHISGSEQAFVSKMNKRAKQLGMLDTLYCNATGLSDAEQYSSAKDTAILLKEVFKHKKYLDYSTVWMDELTHPSGRKTELVNTNKLIRYYKGCDIGKTGFTDEAGYCLTASAERNDMRFIGCVLGLKTKQERFNELSKLFTYGFSNYENVYVINSDDIVKNIKVIGSKIDNVDVYALKSYKALAKKGSQSSYEVNYDLVDKIKAPIIAGESIGTAIISKDGKVVEKIDLVTKQDISKLTYKDGLDKIVDNWFLK